MTGRKPGAMIAVGAAFVAIAAAFFAQNKGGVAAAFVVLGVVFLLRGIRGSGRAR